MLSSVVRPAPRPSPSTRSRRLPIGAELVPGGVHFRVRAPGRKRVDVVVEGGAEHPLVSDGNGYFEGLVAGLRASARYRYRLDGDGAFPDPASRCQPDGPHGPSEVIDPSTFPWTDGAWRGIHLEGQVLMEIHVGTFTPEGTWESAARRIPDLVDVGVTTVELMPVGDFPGEFGWGYDAVSLFAPTRLYGRPDDLRRFVDAAHAHGVGVILDVVYNHLGPDGNYLEQFDGAYFTDRYQTDWGRAIAFEGGPDEAPARELFVANAGYWIDEFHLDGLRLDATQCLYDSSPEHIVTSLTRSARRAAGSRSIIVVGENEPQDIRLVRPESAGGSGLDALWNDDFHHSASVALTGRAEAYYTDYRGTPQELISATRFGFLYQGQRYAWQQKRRGTASLGERGATFVTFLENHDQIANTGLGTRSGLESPGRMRALTALLLLGPGTPMLFQGQEFGSTHPFYYFADHHAELATLVDEGRRAFLAQFPSLTSRDVQAHFPRPSSRATFEACKLDWGERERHGETVALHRELTRLRRTDTVIAAQRAEAMHGAVLGAEALVLRYLGGLEGDRLLLVNLGGDLRLDPAPEPLLAPPENHPWAQLFSTADASFGGAGTPPVEHDGGWRLPAHTAVLFTSVTKGRLA